MHAGNFVVPSPETLTSEDEQPSSAQKPPPETCHEKVSDDDLIPLREKRRATLKPAQLDMNDTDNDSESQEEESSSDSFEEDEEDHAQLPEESSSGAKSRKVLVADSDSDEVSSDDAFLEDVPKKKRRLQLFDGLQEDPTRLSVQKSRSRRSWEKITSLDITTNSDHEIRAALLSAARDDFLQSGTLEPPGICGLFRFVFFVLFFKNNYSLQNAQMLIAIYHHLLAISIATIWGRGRKATFIARKKVCHK
jgi:hypothetical protein